MSLVPFVHVDTSLGGAAAGDEVPLDDTDRHHLTRVLRLPVGAQVELADGTGVLAHGQLTDGAVRLTATPAATAEPARPTLTVVQALPKGRKLDEVVRQVTELGVDRIETVAADRSVARLDGARADKAVARWRSVARAACEQSRRPVRPAVGGPLPVAQLPRPARALLVTDPTADTALHLAVGDLGDVDEVAVAVGPEGGWTDDELATLTAAGATAVRLGPHVLRTEHAAAAALAIVASALGRWG